MKTNISTQNGVMTVAVTGEINTVTTPQLAKAVEDLSGITKLIFDLDQVRYVSSAGLRLFLSCKRTMEAANGDMLIRNCDEFVAETFTIVGYHRLMRIEMKETPENQ